MARTAVRRTQEERSQTTRERLLAATFDILHDQGYGRATLNDIADRAGVSRGALAHHFEGKEDLICQAVDWDLHRTIERISALARRREIGQLSLDRFIDALWDIFAGPTFMVAMEHITESRHNPALHARLVPVTRSFHTALDAIWRDYFKDSGLSSTEIETAFNATLCLLRGMGLQTVLRDDPAYYQRLLGHLKRQTAALLGMNDYKTKIPA